MLSTGWRERNVRIYLLIKSASSCSSHTTRNHVGYEIALNIAPLSVILNEKACVLCDRLCAADGPAADDGGGDDDDDDDDDHRPNCKFIIFD